MDITGLLIFLGIGAVAGWLTGVILKGRSYGLIRNVVIGVIGAIIGGYLFEWLEISTGGLTGSIISATVGAVVLVLIIGMFKKI